MFRRLALAAALALWPSLASAQMAMIAPTAPIPDSTDRIANTSWVNSVLAGGLPLASGKIFIGSAGNLATAQTPSGDLAVSAAGVFTFNTVNSNVGSFGSSTQCVTFTTNAKGLITAASATTCLPALASITGMGTGVATALAVNIGTAGSFVVNGGALGTPASGAVTNLTGLRKTIPATAYFVDDINGNDSNACTSATAGACKTLNGAVARIGGYDLNFQSVTVSVAAPASSYAGMACLQPWIGYGSVTFTGNTGSPTSVLIAGGASSALDIENGCIVTMQGFSLSTTSALVMTQAIFNAQLFLVNIDFAPNATAGGIQLYAKSGGYAQVSGTNTVHGGTVGFCFAQGSHRGEVRFVGGATTFTANSTYSGGTFYVDSGELIGTGSTSISNGGFTVTGPRFALINTGNLQWNGSNPPVQTDIPGTINGTYTYNAATVSGGQQASSTLSLQSTSGAGTTDAIIGYTGSQAERFRVLTGGNFGIGDNNPNYKLTVSKNVTPNVVGVQANTNAVIQVVGPDAAFPILELDGFGGQGVISGTRADGTAGSKTAIAGANEAIYANFAYGWNGSAYTATGGFIINSSEAYTASHTGSYTSLYTTPTGTLGIVEMARLQASGGMSVGPAAAATDPGINNLLVGGAVGCKAPVTLTGTSGTVGVSDCSIIFNPSGAFTATLPAAATYTGRWLHVKSIAAQTVTSASSNVVPRTTATAGTALLASGAGNWADLQSDGTNWIVMSGN